MTIFIIGWSIPNQKNNSFVKELFLGNYFAVLRNNKHKNISSIKIKHALKISSEENDLLAALCTEMSKDSRGHFRRNSERLFFCAVFTSASALPLYFLFFSQAFLFSQSPVQYAGEVETQPDPVSSFSQIWLPPLCCLTETMPKYIQIPKPRPFSASHAPLQGFLFVFALSTLLKEMMN